MSDQQHIALLHEADRAITANIGNLFSDHFYQFYQFTIDRAIP